MPRGQEPLLARSDSSLHSGEGERTAEEEDALLTGQATSRGRSSRNGLWSRYRELVAFAWAFAATIAVIVLAVLFQHSQAQNAPGPKHGHRKGALDPHGRPTGKRNLVFMVSDGMGPASLSLTRSYRQFVNGLPWDDTLTLDGLLIGQSRTRSSSSLVTDSAAGATAFSCGHKSYNGAISVLPGSEGTEDGHLRACGSVMEAAKRVGYTTGLVVTTRITDATPACFASHVRQREMEDSIAEQLVGMGPLGRSVDLILGGGRCHFLSNDTEGSCRRDGQDIVSVAEGKGWNYIETREDFDGVKLGSAIDLPLLGLFAGGDIPFELDREKDVYPSLEEMTETALRALSEATRDSEQGFFILIEGSRIDHAGHNNDPAAQVHEVMAYDRAMQKVLDFFEEDDTPGLMVATSDHETGGLSISRQLDRTYPEYLWLPQALANASHSASWASHAYHEHIRSLDQSLDSDAKRRELTSYLTKLLRKSLGIDNPSSAELASLIDSPFYSPWILADMISRRAQIGWSTHGHSAVDVNIYASDRHMAKKLAGNHENTDVGKFLRWWLDVDDEVKSVTKELHKKLKIQMGPSEEMINGLPHGLEGSEELREDVWRELKQYLHSDL